jgi:hypothetical protein
MPSFVLFSNKILALSKPLIMSVRPNVCLGGRVVAFVQKYNLFKARITPHKSKKYMFFFEKKIIAPPTQTHT